MCIRDRAMVGDQIFADRMAAGLYGCPCLYLMPRTNHALSLIHIWRWTPKAAGGIPTGVALHALTPAAGQESLRLA